MRLPVALVANVVVVVTACASSQTAPACPDQPVEIDFDPDTQQITSRGAEISWGPCPPVLPAGCEMAVLEGDPRSASLFTVRFRTTAPFELSPHWHPRHERVTIFEGQIGIGFGNEVDRESAQWFGPGDYYVNAKGAHHFVLSDGPALIQVTGIGPWEVHYLGDE